MQLIGIALWALIPAFMAQKKGRSFFGFYVLSLLISPLITMIIAACVSNKNADAEQPVNGTENGSDLPDKAAGTDSRITKNRQSTCQKI